VQAQPERRPLAIVFGPEEDGLDMSELALCHDTVRIPSHPAQPGEAFAIPIDGGANFSRGAKRGCSLR